MGAIAQLHAAAEAGDAESVSAAIAAGAPADALLNSQDHHRTALYKACCGGHAECAALLLKAGADPNAATDPDRPPNIGGRRPLHAAACCGDAECLSALLQAGADPTALDSALRPPLFYAALFCQADGVRQLLRAAPQAALMRDQWGETALQQCSYCTFSGSLSPPQAIEVAHCLMAEAPLPPALESLAVLRRVLSCAREWALPLFAVLVARQPLTPSDWELLPLPCPGLGSALPAVLARSDFEARMLVAHLPPHERRRLRTLALCLARAQRSGQLPLLPTSLNLRLLALSVSWHHLVLPTTRNFLA